MKVIKGLTIFSIILVIFGGCFHAPEYSVIPEITLIDQPYFTRSGDKVDSLIVTIGFKDGDGDLGLDGNNPTYLNAPYNENDYYLETDGEIIPVSTSFIRLMAEDSTYILTRVINVPDGAKGKLVTVRTRKKPGYESLKPFDFPYTCTTYRFEKIQIKVKDKDIFDESYNLSDTFPKKGQPEYYQLEDTFFYQMNPHHFNIKIKLLKLKGNVFEEFDWTQQLSNGRCLKSYSGRFPLLDVNKPLEGTLRYAIKTTDFELFFKNEDFMQLKIQILDRALHESNEIRTGDFGLIDDNR